MNLAVDKYGLYEIKKYEDVKYIGDEYVVINKKELGERIVSDLKGCGMVSGDEIHSEIKEFLNGLFEDIRDYAYDYCEDECIEIRFDIL